jgi:hypothetical protein
MRFKGAFVAPADDLNQDIEKKVEAFLQSMGASELYRTKVGPRITQVLESGGYHRRKPRPRRQALSTASTIRETTRGVHSVRIGEVDAEAGVNMGRCTQDPGGGTFTSIGEILNVHPVVQRVRKDMEAQVS